MQPDNSQGRLSQHFQFSPSRQLGKYCKYIFPWLPTRLATGSIGFYTSRSLSVQRAPTGKLPHPRYVGQHKLCVCPSHTGHGQHGQNQPLQSGSLTVHKHCRVMQTLRTTCFTLQGGYPYSSNPNHKTYKLLSRVASKSLV